MNILLRGIVGSTAYGLTREGSDVDRLGVFIAPTVDVAGLYWEPSFESTVGRDPDVTLHEVGKYLRLALRCNPTILELLWLPGDLIEIMHPFFGTRLVGLREAVLSEKCVRDAYGGYAKQQADRLRKRGDSFSSDTRKRTAKHARHLLRLLRQGRHLLETGRLEVRVSDPAEYWAFDDMEPAEILVRFEAEDRLFQAAPSVLPKTPDITKVRDYLDLVRQAYLTRDGA